MYLASACEKVINIPAFQPLPDGTTYCNYAVDLICFMLEYPGFGGLTANQIYSKCKERHRQGSAEEAAQWADEYGYIAIASHFNQSGHGHCAVIYPKKMEISGSYGRPVPFIANVGHINGILKVSQCFKLEDEPHYFLL
jgi:hypothetical protein